MTKKHTQSPRIVAVYPGKAQYEKHQNVEIILELDGVTNHEAFVTLEIYELHNRIMQVKKTVNIGEAKLCVMLDPIVCAGSMAGYGVLAKLYVEEVCVDQSNTSFDIVTSWKLAPRYGFLSDFFERDLNDKHDVEQMNKFHLNVIQFYDWMYRHHELIPKERVFTDVLGRQLSIDVVKQKIDYLHEHGMKAMAYGAVYGAETEFYNEHKDWGLYKNDESPMGFIDFIYLMDISRECGWHDHIINEFMKAIQFGFDGIHMDQYGFPKHAIAKVGGENRVRHLREDYANLINDVKQDGINKGCNAELIFNAVNNYPIEQVAGTAQDAMYIEVWSPNDTYQDLHNLIFNARNLNRSKQVILAAYMKPFSEIGKDKVDNAIAARHAENATLLTMASIFASGGFHLLLGENNGVLSEPYYPDHKCMESEVFIAELRSYYDFIVRYETLLFDLEIMDDSMTLTGGINGEYVFGNLKTSPVATAGQVWTLIKEKPGYRILQLVNFSGIENMSWDKPKAARPQQVHDIIVTALVTEGVEAVYTASPDHDNGAPIKLDFSYVKHDQGLAITFTVPKLSIWEMVYIVLK